jgi:hypothetical protein
MMITDTSHLSFIINMILYDYYGIDVLARERRFLRDVEWNHFRSTFTKAVAFLDGSENRQ